MCVILLSSLSLSHSQRVFLCTWRTTCLWREQSLTHARCGMYLHHNMRNARVVVVLRSRSSLNHRRYPRGASLPGQSYLVQVCLRAPLPQSRSAGAAILFPRRGCKQSLRDVLSDHMHLIVALMALRHSPGWVSPSSLSPFCCLFHPDPRFLYRMTNVHG